MPSRARMRSASLADISPLTALQRLRHLNLIGYGVSDATPLGSMRLTALEVGLNPLTRDSLGAIGRIQALQHLELGGERSRTFWACLLRVHALDVFNASVCDFSAGRICRGAIPDAVSVSHAPWLGGGVGVWGLWLRVGVGLVQAQPWQATWQKDRLHLSASAKAAASQQGSSLGVSVNRTHVLYGVRQVCLRSRCTATRSVLPAWLQV